MKDKINNFINKTKEWFSKTPERLKNIGDWFKNLPSKFKEIPAKLKNFVEKIKNYNYKNMGNDLKVIFSSDGAIKLYSSLGCILVSLLIGFIIMVAIDPKYAASEFRNLLTGGMLFSSASFYAILANTAPLLCCGLSIVFANKTGMFNIGVAGQYTIGIFASLMFAIQFNCPWYVCVLMAMVFGAIWAGIPGLLKAYLNVSEVLSGIMLNWVALFFTNYSFQTYLASCVNVRDGMKTFKLPSVNQSALIPDFGLKSSTGGYFTISIFIALIAAIVIAFILRKTTLGYQLKASGLNKNATRYAGIKDKRNIVISLAISGALAGLGAALYYLADLEQYSVQASSALPQLPWNGIIVAFLGQLSPVGTIFATLFTSLITQGSTFMLQTSFPAEIGNIITGVVVYLSGLTSLLIILANKYIFKKKAMKTEALLETANNEGGSSVEVNSDTLTKNIDENTNLNANELDDEDGGK